jgi:uncharacterized membrane protein HdeD (DUF308 family)
MERSELAASFGALWWMGIVQGLLMIFFGAAALFWPNLTLLTLVYMFSGFILAWGIIEIIRGLMGINRRNSWWLSLGFGLAGLIVGIYLARNLNVSLATFILLVGLLLVGRGIFDLVGAFLDKDNKTDKVFSAVAGLAALAAGIIILLYPTTGGIAFVWVLGIYAIIAGSMVLATAIGLHDALSIVDQPGRRSAVQTRKA